MTTYVLGAGASAHAGYPTAKDLWRNLVEWVRENPDGDVKDRTALRWIDRHCGESIDVEDVLTRLQTGEGRFKKLAVNADRLHSLVRHAIGRYFLHLHFNGARARCYEELARNASRGDVFVTFNYDVALDAALNREKKFRVKDGYWFNVDWDEPESDVLILKPHGSINWLAVPFGGRPGYYGGSPSTSSSYPLPKINNVKELLPEYPRRVLDTQFQAGRWHEYRSLILPARDKQYRVISEFSPREMG